MKKKTVEEYLKLPYTIETKKDSDGTFFIKVKELKGCMSVGESIQEAYEMIEDAMRSWIESMLEDGLSIPEPEIDEEKSYSGKFSVRVPKWLHKKVALQAQENDVSMNLYVADLLASKTAIIEEKDRIINSILTSVGSQFSKSAMYGSGYMKFPDINPKEYWIGPGESPQNPPAIQKRRKG